FAAQQQILRDVFTGQDDRRGVHRNQRRRIANNLVEPLPIFSRQPETPVPRAAALDLLLHEWLPARLDAGQHSDRSPLDFGNGLADLAEDALLLILPQRRPYLGARHPAQPRHDEIRPSVALAFVHDFRDRYADAPTKLRE